MGGGGGGGKAEKYADRNNLFFRKKLVPVTVKSDVSHTTLLGVHSKFSIINQEILYGSSPSWPSPLMSIGIACQLFDLFLEKKYCIYISKSNVNLHLSFIV